MKVAIVDDKLKVVKDISVIAKEAGHEVQGVNFDPYCDKDEFDSADILHTSSIAVATDAIRAFDPEIIFLDHFLDSAHIITEAAIIKELAFDKMRYVCTSTNRQEYCGRYFCFDKSELSKYKGAQIELLRLISTAK